MKLKNIFLITSLAAFAVGFSDLQENVIFWSGRPVGAILLGLYMIFLVLEGCSAEYDQEQSGKVPNAKPSPLKQTKEGRATSFMPASTH